MAGAIFTFSYCLSGGRFGQFLVAEVFERTDGIRFVIQRSTLRMQIHRLARGIMFDADNLRTAVGSRATRKGSFVE
jgi:hypothetical protein